MTIAQIDPEKLSHEVQVNPADLDNCMMEQASMYAYYAVVASKAQRTEGTKKVLLEVTEAKVAKAIRDRAAVKGEKITEAQISKEIALDGSYVKALLAYNEAKAQSQLARDALDAFRHRKDMLIQMGLSRREELKGELYIKSREASEKADLHRVLAGKHTG